MVKLSTLLFGEEQILQGKDLEPAGPAEGAAKEPVLVILPVYWPTPFPVYSIIA